jgi:hypothetical protein
MQNDLKYSVRSREIIDLVAAMRTSRLTLSPYFQRNLVWRDAHRRDFIDTILKGLPFPQIFLARGPIDLDTMEACQCVVDGQQRLNTIRDFVLDRLDVEGRHFSDLTKKQKEDFLKYEVPVIDFDLDAGDERLKDVFHRLNRTYYSLSAIEKIASEYSASEFLLIARVLCGEIVRSPLTDEDELSDIGSENEDIEPIAANVFGRDPGVDDATWAWLVERAEGPYSQLIRDHSVFTSFEFDRKVPLMFTLNLMCTYLTGYFNRNDRVRKYLDERAVSFPERDEVISALNDSSHFVASMALPADSIWWNKANFFSLIAEISRCAPLRTADPARAAEKLVEFAENLPSEYALAAREATGRKGQRELRGTAVRTVLESAMI